MLRAHLRSNVVGYLALFVALSGTAVALPATNTVFGDDIVNGEVSTKDISDSDGVRSADVRDDDKRGGGLAAADLARNSVGPSEIDEAAVRRAEIGPDAVNRPEIATDGVGSPEIAANAVRESDIAKDAVGASEIAPTSITGEEVKSRTLDSFLLKSFSVGSTELVSIYERASAATVVTDATAHDGIYGRAIAAVTCEEVGEKLLSASMDWTDTNGVNEAMLSEVFIDRSGAFDQAVLAAVFDGGGGTANPARFVANATCMRE
jgi:hypothetical protein